MKSTKCNECWGSNGRHMSYCQTRGYSAIGPHPDAPQATPPKPAEIAQCPCGISRLDCDYHRPGSDGADNGPATERYEVFDLCIGGVPIRDSAAPAEFLAGCEVDVAPKFMQESVERATASLQAAGLLSPGLGLDPRCAAFEFYSGPVCDPTCTQWFWFRTTLAGTTRIAEVWL